MSKSGGQHPRSRRNGHGLASVGGSQRKPPTDGGQGGIQTPLFATIIVVFKAKIRMIDPNSLKDEGGAFKMVKVDQVEFTQAGFQVQGVTANASILTIVKANSREQFAFPYEQVESMVMIPAQIAQSSIIQ